MFLQCQKVEIKKIPFLASDITNFTSAVCAVVLEMSTIGEPIFETWANTYSSDLYSSYTTVYSYSSEWGSADSSVNSFVYNTSANILSVNSVVNTHSANWDSVYSEFNNVSSNLITFVSGDSRYVNLSGDVMFGGLSAPSISADTIYVGNSTINFFDENFQVVENLKGSDVTKFKSNYNTVNSKSALWDDVYTEFSSQSADNTSVYNQVNSQSANWVNPPPQTLSFNESNSELSISNGNTVNLSALNDENYLPLSGGTLTGDLNIQANISSVNAIQFNTATAVTVGAGQMAWNSAEATLNLGVNDEVTLQLGQEILVQAKNTSGEIIYNGAPVFASGAVGTGSGNIAVSAYRAGVNDPDELYFLGVATEQLDVNEFGFVTTFGKVRDVKVSEVRESLDVSSWPIGTILYPSAVERGKLTSIPPNAPDKALPIVIIISVNGSNRGFFVRADHGYHLNEMHDVVIINPINSQVLSYNSASGVWTNASETDPVFTSWANSYSGNYQSVYNTVNTYSATQWNYQGTDIKSLTSNWENTYTQFSLQSADNLNITTVVENNSSTWGAADIPQVLSFNESNAELSISNGNTVSLSSLSGGTGPSGEPLFTSWAQTYSGNYDSVYSTVQSNSSTTWNYQGNDIKALSSNWENTYNSFSVQSANNLSVYNTVQTNSSTTWNYQGTDVKILTANWENTYTTVQTNSAQWAIDSTIDVGVRSLTSNWQDTYTNFSSQSANNSSVYNTVQTNSATTWNYQGTDIKSLTSNWQASYTALISTSGDWNDTRTTVNTYSSTWGTGGGTIDVGVRALTSNWQDTYTAFSTQSANNSSVYTTVNSSSANWDSVYTNVNSNSANAYVRASIGITIDGGGSAITTGSKGFISIPYSCTIINNTIVSDQSGSIVIDVKKATYAGFPTTTSICAAAKPTLSSSQKSTDSTLTGWTTTVNAGDILEFYVDSASTVTRVTLTLGVNKFT